MTSTPPGTTPDAVAACLDEVRERSRWTSSATQVAAPGANAVASAEDVPRLLAALDGVLALADGWMKEARRCDRRADRTDGDIAAGLYYRAQAHQDAVEAVREAISRALLPEESHDD